MNSYPPNLGARQKSLFPAEMTENTERSSSSACEIVAVGRRRDGGTRYWCLTHKADATAKYGVAAQQCKRPQVTEVGDDEIFTLDLDQYPGGIALWGAVPPVYDTTECDIDRGIHVHARAAAGESKSIDRSFLRLRVIGKAFEGQEILISEVEAIYYMASSVFGYTTSPIACSYCGHLHLDKDFFSVHRIGATCAQTVEDTFKTFNVASEIRSAEFVKRARSQQGRRFPQTVHLISVSETFPEGFRSGAQILRSSGLGKRTRKMAFTFTHSQDSMKSLLLMKHTPRSQSTVFFSIP
jgi:hypothetical protein